LAVKSQYLKIVSDFVKRTKEYQEFATQLKNSINHCQFCGRSDLELIVHHDPPAVHQLAKIWDPSKDSFENAKIFFEKHKLGEISVFVICKCCHLVAHNKIKRRCND